MLTKYRKYQGRWEQREESGFTLIELLIVIVVLGILAAVVVFALGGVTGQSAVAACNSDAKTVEIAVTAAEEQYPGAVLTTGANSNLITGSSLGGNTYLKSWPNSTYYTIALDPATGFPSGGSAYAVNVALKSTDPGAATATNPTPPAGAQWSAEPATPGVTAWDYDGGGTASAASGVITNAGAYEWGAGNTISATSGSNICAGA